MPSISDFSTVLGQEDGRIDYTVMFNTIQRSSSRGRQMYIDKSDIGVIKLKSDSGVTF